MKPTLVFLTSLLVALICPSLLQAQTTDGISQLHVVLKNVYKDMLPLCADILDVSRAIGAFGGTFYIGVRVWKHIAQAEPINFFPLFRPMVLVALIGMFPKVIALIDAIFEPTVTATAALVTHSNDAVNNLLLEEAVAMTNDPADVVMTPNVQGGTGWDKYTQPDATGSDSGGGFWSAIGAGFKFLAGSLMSSFKFIFQLFLSIILRLLFYAAGLCIDAVRTFHMLVLAILGPFAFAISCYDGFHNSLTNWLGRYINVYLWLPVANVFGAILAKVQVNMLQIDVARLQSGSGTVFSSTDFAYLIFLVMGVIGYFTVPSITNYIIHTHGSNPILSKINSAVKVAAAAAAGA